MIFTDKNKTEIKDGDALVFSFKDEMEPGGYNVFATDVKLCFFDGVTNKYIPLEQHNSKGKIDEAIIVKNFVNTKNLDI